MAENNMTENNMTENNTVDIMGYMKMVTEFAKYIRGIFQFSAENHCNDLVVQAFPMYWDEHPLPDGVKSGDINSFIGAKYDELVEANKKYLTKGDVDEFETIVRNLKTAYDVEQYEREQRKKEEQEAQEAHEEQQKENEEAMAAGEVDPGFTHPQG